MVSPRSLVAILVALAVSRSAYTIALPKIDDSYAPLDKLADVHLKIGILEHTARNRPITELETLLNDYRENVKFLHTYMPNEDLVVITRILLKKLAEGNFGKDFSVSVGGAYLPILTDLYPDVDLKTKSEVLRNLLIVYSGLNERDASIVNEIVERYYDILMGRATDSDLIHDSNLQDYIVC